MTIYTVTFRPEDVGLALTDADFVVFQKLEDGTAPTNAAPATVTGIGLGMYKFEYTAAEDVAFILDGGAGITSDADRYIRGVLSPIDDRLDVAVSTRASQTSVDGLATEAGLDAVNVNLAQLDARVQIAVDVVEELYQLEYGRWKIHTSGADENFMVIYDEDGVTEVARFALKDAAGNPAYRNIFERVPV